MVQNLLMLTLFKEGSLPCISKSVPKGSRIQAVIRRGEMGEVRLRLGYRQSLDFEH